MSVDAGLHITLIPDATPITAVGALIDAGWGGCANEIWLVPGDSDDIGNWVARPHSTRQALSELLQRFRGHGSFGVRLFHRSQANQEGGEFLGFAPSLLVFSPTINRRVAFSRTSDVTWYLAHILRALDERNLVASWEWKEC